ncbi:hypothetical protein VPNG_04841 [Cytospora leucostoma]|uniref:Glucose-methanol-choline oxidoreductase N-terminal domain-containing protein n=1 Tax=Cytospora leucostoma TaxID=1230097 RepID=A0A423XBB6_9PEZI|nr:hypothetical protein VPNG_04841 [Cytospora leucostoma]
MLLQLWASRGILALALWLDASSCLFIPPAEIDVSLHSQYDYIVVGGGASGLVVANRLTEDPDVTVLVLEAGSLDTEEATVTVPADIGQDLYTGYDWMLHTVEQEHLNGQQVDLNQGKAIGGGTILNGMVWTRGSAKDYDSWGNLNHIEGQANQYNWRWGDLLPYFEKSEHFTADVDTAIQDVLHIYPDMSIHANFLSGMVELNLSITSEPNDGTLFGAMMSPSSMSARNQSRFDGRTAYFDPVIQRPNLHIATEQTVTQILLETVDQLQTAVGVEFAHSDQEDRRNISCSSEVILAAGAIFSPTLLQVSGIGPENVLRSLNIPLRVDLPGVGANFQDHGMLHPVYSYTNDSVFTALTVHASDESLAAASDEYYTNQSGPLTAPLISTIAFPALQDFADDWIDLLNEAQQRDINSTLPPDTPATVRQGYLAQRQYQIPLLRDPTEGAIEVLADSIGTLSVAMQRPLSRGTVRPGSSNMFDSPIVDPRYCSEPFDCILLARALLFNCALINTTAMAELQPVVQEPYFCPDDLADFDRAGVDSRMLDLARQNIATEFHPSGSTAMLPLELGGVVDTELRVYGTQNVRVVDAGVMPLVLGAHLQAAVYAMAERAADIIKENALYGQASSSSNRGVSGTTGPNQPGLVGMG